MNVCGGEKNIIKKVFIYFIIFEISKMKIKQVVDLFELLLFGKRETE